MVVWIGFEIETENRKPKTGKPDSENLVTQLSQKRYLDSEEDRDETRFRDSVKEE